jgi:hypothetical protein
MTIAAMDVAAEYGQFEILKWPYKNCTECCTNAAIDKAATNGHFEIAQWLCNNNYKFSRF